MSDLLPCPFCGGEAELLGSTLDGYRVACIGMCYCSTQRYRTKHEAIAAWNTRVDVERDAVPMTEENMAKHGWVRERTCEFVDDSDGVPSPPKCSACGYDPGIYGCAWYDDGTYGYERNYCPNCGAKVEQ